jgi:ribosome recycling factor
MNERKPKMRSAVERLAGKLRGIRTGTVSAGLIQTISVLFGGDLVPIKRLGVVRSQGDRILINPFDPASVPAVVKALCDPRLSAYALNPKRVSVSIPSISVEQREEISRHVKKPGEEARIAVRAIRRNARKQLVLQR